MSAVVPAGPSMTTTICRLGDKLVWCPPPSSPPAQLPPPTTPICPPPYAVPYATGARVRYVRTCWDHHLCLEQLWPDECPTDPNLPRCNEVPVGELCEKDNECFLSPIPEADNCGTYDVYRT